uniref:Myb/SANT-like domain-containing protein n=1 Tax=Oryza sativa subsp. japonica TaxID=39947 RepID=Q2QUS6_ORYSJ|nr:hypothetical protein LOC_Os12g15250 [Oryza sativa Japonica Group]
MGADSRLPQPARGAAARLLLPASGAARGAVARLPLPEPPCARLLLPEPPWGMAALPPEPPWGAAAHPPAPHWGAGPSRPALPSSKLVPRVLERRTRKLKSSIYLHLENYKISNLTGQGDLMEWTDEHTTIVCQLFAQQVVKGNRPNTHLNSVGYDEVIQLFRQITGIELSKRQLRNKWDKN